MQKAGNAFCRVVPSGDELRSLERSGSVARYSTGENSTLQGVAGRLVPVCPAMMTTKQQLRCRTRRRRIDLIVIGPVLNA